MQETDQSYMRYMTKATNAVSQLKCSQQASKRGKASAIHLG